MSLITVAVNKKNRKNKKTNAETRQCLQTVSFNATVVACRSPQWCNALQLAGAMQSTGFSVLGDQGKEGSSQYVFVLRCHSLEF